MKVRGAFVEPAPAGGLPDINNPGSDDQPPGRRDWRGIERPEPHRDFARDHERDDLESD